MMACEKCAALERENEALRKDNAIFVGYIKSGINGFLIQVVMMLDQAARSGPGSVGLCSGRSLAGSRPGVLMGKY